jgi:hypothetical protein
MERTALRAVLTERPSFSRIGARFKCRQPQSQKVSRLAERRPARSHTAAPVTTIVPLEKDHRLERADAA